MFVRLFAEFKFVSLFSLLFGVGMAIAAARAVAAGRNSKRLAARRLVFLGCVGLVHGLALWFGDILFVYSLFGALLVACLGWEARKLFMRGAAALVLSLLLGSAGGAHSMLRARAPAVESASAPAASDVFASITAAGFDPSHPTWIAAETRAHQKGPASAALGFRAAYFAMCTLAAPFSYGWRVFGLMAIGAALWRWGFFGRDRHELHLRLIRWGLAPGLVLEAAGIALSSTDAARSIGGATGVAFLHEVGSGLLAAGYLGALMVFAHSGHARKLVGLVATCGRMPLTVYITQTLIGICVSEWWGLGLFGKLSRPALLGVALVIIVVQIALAAVWMRRFRMGPLEWLWRAVTYGSAPRLAR